MTAVELFAGAGGLALGVSMAGFAHLALVERDRDCCATIRENQSRGVEHVVDWPLHQADVREVDYSIVTSPVDLLAAGPPCQPFSIGGTHKGSSDPRNLFGEVARAARELRPRAVLIENVRGLLRPAFSSFFQYVLLQLSHPDVAQKDGEDWTAHHKRLEQHHNAGGTVGAALQLHVLAAERPGPRHSAEARAGVLGRLPVRRPAGVELPEADALVRLVDPGEVDH